MQLAITKVKQSKQNHAWKIKKKTKLTQTIYHRFRSTHLCALFWANSWSCKWINILSLAFFLFIPVSYQQPRQTQYLKTTNFKEYQVACTRTNCMSGITQLGTDCDVFIIHCIWLTKIYNEPQRFKSPNRTEFEQFCH